MDENIQDLPRSQRRKILREQEKEKEKGDEAIKRLRNWGIILAVALGILGVGYWMFREATKPLPGQAVAELGRNHVTDIAGITYNSNPPTSGPHFPVWAKPGVYDRLISDGYFLHSMEHGYIVIWYDCEKPMANSRWLMVKEALAHDEPTKDSTDSGQLLKHMTAQLEGQMSWITSQSQPAQEVALPASFGTDSCKSLISQLSEFTKMVKRVIVTPRVGMDTPIALTAWGRIDKLTKVDKDEITKFIRAFHNRGPEQTTE